MIRLLGSVLILCASLAVPMGEIRRTQQEICLYQQFRDALRRMSREIEHHGAQMQELIDAGKQTAGIVGEFFSEIKISALSERSLKLQWNNALQQFRAQKPLYNALLPLGEVLGCYDRETQCASLNEAADQLETLSQQQRQRLAHSRRLWYTLSLSSAFMLVLLLL